MPYARFSLGKYTLFAIGVFVTAAMFMVYAPASRAAPLSLQVTPFASGFAQPLGAVSTNVSGDTRMFVLQKNGVIKIVQADGTILATPFLSVPASTAGEQGLLSVAFDPQYQANGRVFALYTDLSGNIVLARYTVSGNPDIADVASATVLLTIPHPTNTNHNGGDLAFGTDGYLYLSTGDGGSGYDPPNNAQNLSVLLGKLLRLDVSSGLTVPPTNPFVAQSGETPKVFSYGLRNPWRLSFDRSTGDLFVADVGQGAREEVNVVTTTVAKGANFGWRCIEGSLVTGLCGSLPTQVAPIAQYDHGEGRCSISGGYIYRGTQFPSMVGHYFYGDFCSGDIFSIDKSSGQWLFDRQTKLSGVMISSFGQDSAGELYVVGYNNGTLYKLTNTERTHPDGTLVRKAGEQTVYLIDEGARRVVPSAGVFLQNGYLWRQVRLATATDSQLPLGTPLALREGMLVKGSSSAIYAIEYAGSTPQKRHITTLAAFQGLGYRFSEVMTVADADLPGASGVDITTATTHPDGALVMVAGDPKLYQLDNGTRRHVMSLPALLSYGFNFSYIKAATSADAALPEGAQVILREGSVYTFGSNFIWAMEYVSSTYQKRQFMTYPGFLALGYSLAEVYQVSSAESPSNIAPFIP
jgi:glucose/arabinose dehydrogenase